MKPKKKYIAWGITLLVFGAIYLAERFSRSFSDLVNDTVARFVRKALAWIAKLFPFSVFELLVAAGTVFVLTFLVFLIIFIIKRIRKKECRLPIKNCAIALGLALTYLFVTFTLTLAPAYNATGVAEKMELDTDITRDDIFNAFEYLCNVMKDTEKNLSTDENGVTKNPYSFSQLAEKVFEASDAFSEKYPFYQKGVGTAKKLVSSKPMTYTFITGIYGPFTGESNINSNFPDLILAPTIAHEFSHARGIAPENECNFLGFAICLSSGDPYVRYCGAAFMLDDLASACRKNDPERYAEYISLIPERYRNDLKAYNAFLTEYSTPIAEVSDKVNSAYLKSQGQKDGTLSYSNTVGLVTAYITNL